MTEVVGLEDFDHGVADARNAFAQQCRIRVTCAEGNDSGDATSFGTDLNMADDAIAAASCGANGLPRALRVEELIYDADRISRSGSYSSLSGDTSGTDGDVDSRPNSGEAPLDIPSDELIQRIVDQVEFYFSDENILKDAFLLKHVRRNKMGFVSLKLITSFKRIKSLTKDYRVAAYALRNSSQKLEVNSEGTKVRRLIPLPAYDETSTSRTVIAIMPVETDPSFDDVANLFKDCGEIMLIRIVKSGAVVPPDLKMYMNKHPQIGQQTCAVIEFDTHAAAERASAMSATDDGGGGGEAGLLVALLAPPKSGKKKEAVKEAAAAKEAAAMKTKVVVDAQQQDKNRKLKKKNDRLAAIAQDSPSVGSGASDSETEFPSINETESRNGRHHQRQPHSNKENSPGRADRQGNWRSPIAVAPQAKTSSPAQRFTPGSSPANTPKSTPRSSPQVSPRMGRRSITNQNTPHSRPSSGNESPSPLAHGHGRRSDARPSPMSSPEAIRRRRSAGAIARQQQQQLIAGVSPLANEPVSLSRSPPAGASPPREALDPSGKPPLYPFGASDLGMSPWVQRRLQAAEDVGEAGTSGSASPGTSSPGRANSPAVARRRNDAPPRLLDSLGVLRQPRGPDGTRGFHAGVRESLKWPPFLPSAVVVA